MRGIQPWKTNRARVLRSNGSSAEDKLWFHLRNRRLGGFKFVRQLAIENYFVDFCCRNENLIVEIDGGTHSTPPELAKDQEREAALTTLGYKIVRVQNTDIFENIDGVLDLLLGVLEDQSTEP